MVPEYWEVLVCEISLAPAAGATHLFGQDLIINLE